MSTIKTIAALTAALLSSCINAVNATTPALTEAQVSSLIDAHQDDYLVRVLSGSVEGVERNLILLGEKHVKNELSAVIGQHVLTQFPLRGIEGVHVEGPLAKLALSTVFLPINLMYAASNLFSSRTHGSTIDEVFTDKPKTLVLENVENAHTETALLEANAGDLITVLGASFPPVILADVALSLTQTGRAFIMERPWLAASSLFIKLQLLHFAYKVGSVSESDEVTPTFSPYIFPFHYWITDYRNNLMVENTIQALASRPYAQTFLIIIGQYHVSGMSTLFRDNYGFTDITDEVLFR